MLTFNTALPEIALGYLIHSIYNEKGGNHLTALSFTNSCNAIFTLVFPYTLLDYTRLKTHR